jgi:hypothetical protein
MNPPRHSPAPNGGVQNALNHLKQAEVALLAVVHAGTHPKNDLLLEAHAFVWEAISTLSKALALTSGS